MADVAPRVSECTICPPWVVACAHFEGREVWIVGPCADYPGYKVHGPTISSTIYHAGTGATGRRHPDCGAVRAPDLASAQAEFRKREEELLRPVQSSPPPTH